MHWPHPVPNGGCDLAFASHIIEHLPDPQGFIDEIKRCSRRVYLEFPARSRELLYAWPFHEWFVEAHGTALKFYRNDLPQLFGPLFHEEYDAALSAWSEARHEYLNTSIHCRSDEITCEFPSETATELVLRDAPHGHAKMDAAKSIHRPQYSLREIAAFAAQSILPNGAYTRLSRPRMRPTSPAPLPDSVLRRLMCLRCRGTSLSRIADVVACPCGARYCQDRGVFDFDA
jgi:SAM-dependent methyltransferase